MTRVGEILSDTIIYDSDADPVKKNLVVFLLIRFIVFGGWFATLLLWYYAIPALYNYIIENDYYAPFSLPFVARTILLS